MDSCKGCKFKKTPTSLCESCWDQDQFRRQTQADRIRAMSDEELAEFLGDYNRDWPFGTPQHVIDDTSKWLKQRIE